MRSEIIATVAFEVSLLATVSAGPAPSSRERLQAEFVLPIYLNRHTAALVLKRSAHTGVLLQLTVSFCERTTGLTPRGPMLVDVPPGAQGLTAPVQIGGWSDGQHPITIR